MNRQCEKSEKNLVEDNVENIKGKSCWRQCGENAKKNIEDEIADDKKKKVEKTLKNNLDVEIFIWNIIVFAQNKQTENFVFHLYMISS